MLVIVDLNDECVCWDVVNWKLKIIGRRDTHRITFLFSLLCSTRDSILATGQDIFEPCHLSWDALLSLVIDGCGGPALFLSFELTIVSAHLQIISRKIYRHTSSWLFDRVHASLRHRLNLLYIDTIHFVTIFAPRWWQSHCLAICTTLVKANIPLAHPSTICCTNCLLACPGIVARVCDLLSDGDWGTTEDRVVPIRSFCGGHSSGESSFNCGSTDSTDCVVWFVSGREVFQAFISVDKQAFLERLNIRLQSRVWLQASHLVIEFVSAAV